MNNLKHHNLWSKKKNLTILWTSIETWWIERLIMSLERSSNFMLCLHFRYLKFILWIVLSNLKEKLSWFSEYKTSWCSRYCIFQEIQAIYLCFKIVKLKTEQTKSKDLQKYFDESRLTLESSSVMILNQPLEKVQTIWKLKKNLSHKSIMDFQ